MKLTKTDLTILTAMKETPLRVKTTEKRRGNTSTYSFDWYAGDLKVTHGQVRSLCSRGLAEYHEPAEITSPGKSLLGFLSTLSERRCKITTEGLAALGGST